MTQETITEEKQTPLAAAIEKQYKEGVYSIGYMDVKMKSEKEWKKLYGKIVKGGLYFRKSYSVI
jgi:disulfide oxidoreductase YuzD